jgi:2-keto-4-pentenoate hydratase/2-oxohepta-3-ene-1,7-dioic acid hydratase in catechol pathway
VQSPSLEQRLAASGNYELNRAAFVARQPMGRFGTPEEIAELAAYLASDAAAFTTGQCHIIDGGWSNWPDEVYSSHGVLAMKLVRYGPVGTERPGFIDAEGLLRDLSFHVDDIAGESLSRQSLLALSRIEPHTCPIVPRDSRLGACVGRVGKFVCIGLNYADHAAESGAEVPSEPVIFLKATTAICGPFDSVIRPRDSRKLDWEVELGVVIGERAKHVAVEAAADYVAGYCVINDISEREFQLERGGTWDKGKGCDTFGPTGPWLVTRDEIADVNNLAMWLDVNGRRFQSGSTRTMIFKPDYLVSYVSHFMTLLPGDIISTGTPPGVGLGQKPPCYLKTGDLMELGIESLGRQRQIVITEQHGIWLM